LFLLIFFRNSQGWVDEDSESGIGNPFSKLFCGGKKKTEEEEKGAQTINESKENPKKNGFGWPF
jgi:hypothetical protein